MSDYKFYLGKDPAEDIKPVNKAKSKKRRKILEELEELELMSEEPEPIQEHHFLASSFVPEKKPKKWEEPTKEQEDQDINNWMDVITSISDTASNMGKGKKKVKGDIFDNYFNKRKKKKKKKKGEIVDYHKEFETEAALYRNLLQDQNRFTDSLQKEYDRLKSTKSTSRGISKTMTDLIESITQARSLSMQIVDKTVNLKKTTADLMFKQKKELNAGLEDGANLSEFASSYLKQMLNERQSLIQGSGIPDIMEYDDEAVDDLLDGTLDGFDRSEEVDKFLSYENKDVTLYAVINPMDYSDYEFRAFDNNGEAINDYPLPTKTSLSINDSTMVATDTYGRKYPIKWSM